MIRTKFLTDDELEVFQKRISRIENEEDKLATMKSVLYHYELDDEVIRAFNYEDSFNSDFVSIHPNLSWKVVERFPEFFNITKYLEGSANPKLIVNKEFRKTYNISDSEVCKFLRRLDQISENDFLQLDLHEDNPEIVALLIAKVNYNGSPLVKESIKEAKEEYKEKLITLDIAKTSKIDFSIEDYKYLLKSSFASPELLGVLLEKAKEYPTFIEEVLDEFAKRIKDKSFNTNIWMANENPVPLNSLISSAYKVSTSVRAIALLYEMNPESINKNFFGTYLSIKDLSEDDALMLLPILQTVLTYDQCVRFAREKDYNLLLLNLAMKDAGDNGEIF